jgi:phospholipid/cholesterol/gamma-HCH transport system ATP-binding protein
MTGADQPKIQLSGVTRAFEDVRALDGVDLTLAPRQSLVLIGGSGSGKSLLLKCILGLIPPDSGSIKVDGIETVGMPENERMVWMQRFGVLFQRQGLFDSMTIWENIAFRLINEDRLAPSEARDRAIARLGQVGLTPDTADLYPSEVSGGMQKRVGLARAIATDPEILFLDEPTAGLDPIMSNIISELINERVDELGATVVSIVSNLDVVRNIADSVLMLHAGQVVWNGPVAELDETDNPYVRQFVTQSIDGPIEMPKLAG